MIDRRLQSARPFRRASGTGARRLANRRGVTAVIVVLCVVPLAGMLALAVDLGLLYRTRRNAQTAADAAALAYAWECYRYTITPASTATCPTGTVNTNAKVALDSAAISNGYTNGANGRVITVTAPSFTAATWGTAPAVQVTVQDTVKSLFGKLLGRNTTVVSARAIATWSLAPSTACAMALNPTASNALDTQGTPKVSAPGCQVVVNSNATTAASTGGNATVTASAIAVTGGVSGSGFSPTPSTGVPPSLNPLANVTAPNVPACTFSSNYDQKPNDPALNFAPTVTGGTAVFCGAVSIKGTANFAAGTYIFRQGLTVTSQGTVTGTTGVTFINMPYGSPTCDVTKTNPDCQLYIQAGASLNLTAPSTGPYKGILFYQPASLPAASIWANSTSTINGAFYFPSATLEMGGGANMTVNGPVIADKIALSGNSTLTINAPTTASGGYFPGKRVTLVD